MLVRAIVLLGLLLSGLVAPPAAAATAPAASSPQTLAPAAGGQVEAMTVTAKKKPRASLTASYVVLESGTLRVSVTSNAKKVKLTYRTKKNKKRSATIRIRGGEGVKTLRKGSKKISAQAKATKKLRKSRKVRVRPAVPPVLAPPPVVTPPVVTPPVTPPPVTPPPVVDVTPPGPVSGLAVTDATASAISLAWTNPGDADLARVIVRRAAGSSAPASPTGGTAVPLSGPVASSVTDAGLVADTPYSYAVFTRDTTGNTSAAATVTGRTNPLPDTSAPAAPSGLLAAGRDGAVDVSWDAVVAPDLAGYWVYSSGSPDGPWSRAAAAPVTDPQAAVDGLANGTQYWFRITAIDVTGNESAPSLPASGVPAGEPIAPSKTVLIDPDSETLLEVGGFAVRVPAGSVTSAGVALTVTPLPLLDQVLPSVDVHIHGGWDPAAGGVTISLPFPFEEATRATVLHQAADGLRISSGRFAVISGTGQARTVSVSLSSLSPTVSAPGSSECPTEPLLQEFWLDCSDNDDIAVEQVWLEQAEKARQQALADALASRACSGRVNDVAVTGSVIERAMGCSPALDVDRVGVHEFANDTHTKVLLREYPLAVNFTTSGGPSAVQVDTTDVPWLYMAAAPLGDDLLLPGATATIRKTRDPHETDVTWRIDSSATLLVAWSNFVAGWAGDDALDRSKIPPAALIKAAQCGSNEVTDTVLGCLRDVGIDLALQFLDKAGATKVGTVLTMIDLTLALAAFGDAFDSQSHTTHLINSTPTRPPSGRAGDSWIARNPDNGRAVLVEGSIVRPITDGDTFLDCAKTRMVWDIATLEALRDAVAEPATCDNTGRTEWDPRPGTPPTGGNVGVDIILRNPEGNTWLVNTSGELQSIEVSGTYECLATANPVIWNVANSAVDVWTPKQLEPASCGQGTGALPPIAAVPFAFVRPEADTVGYQVVAPTTNGWWLTAGRSADTDWTYRWVGPDGREGPSWDSHYDPASAIPGPDGSVFVVAHDRRGSDLKVLFRVDGDGFGQALNLGLDPWNPFSGNVVMGHDGNLYWNNADSTRTMWVNQIDPSTLQVTGRVSVSNDNVWIAATPSGIVAEFYDGRIWRIPYDGFRSRDGSRWDESSASPLHTKYHKSSIGMEGTAAIAHYPGMPYCTTVQVSSRRPDGTQWIKPLSDWTADTLSDCDFEDLDTRPDGGLVLTLKSRDITRDGSYLLFVSESGEREGMSRIDVAGARLTTQIDSAGLALTSYTRPEACSDPELSGCSRVMLVGHRGTEEVLRDSWIGPEQTLRWTGATNPSYIFLGPGQVGTYVLSTPRNTCGTNDSCTPYNSTMSFRVKTVAAQIASSPLDAWW